MVSFFVAYELRLSKPKIFLRFSFNLFHRFFFSYFFAKPTNLTRLLNFSGSSIISLISLSNNSVSFFSNTILSTSCFASPCCMSCLMPDISRCVKKSIILTFIFYSVILPAFSLCHQPQSRPGPPPPRFHWGTPFLPYSQTIPLCGVSARPFHS